MRNENLSKEKQTYKKKEMNANTKTTDAKMMSEWIMEQLDMWQQIDGIKTFDEYYEYIKTTVLYNALRVKFNRSEKKIIEFLKKENPDLH